MSRYNSTNKPTVKKYMYDCNLIRHLQRRMDVLWERLDRSPSKRYKPLPRLLTDVRGEYKTCSSPSGNYSKPSAARNLRFVRASIPWRGELLKSRLRRERSFAKIPLAATKQNQRTLRLLIGIICSRRAFHPFSPDRPFSFRRAEEKIPTITSA